MPGGGAPLDKLLPSSGSVYVARLNGQEMPDEVSTFQHFSEVLKLPEHFGWNWNAFHVCVRDLHLLSADNRILIIESAESILSQDGDSRKKFFGCLWRAGALVSDGPTPSDLKASRSQNSPLSSRATRTAYPPSRNSLKNGRNSTIGELSRSRAWARVVPGAVATASFGMPSSRSALAVYRPTRAAIPRGGRSEEACAVPVELQLKGGAARQRSRARQRLGGLRQHRLTGGPGVTRCPPPQSGRAAALFTCPVPSRLPGAHKYEPRGRAWRAGTGDGRAGSGGPQWRSPRHL
ncbi:barstar family protein [Streptomyces avidinii]|uniref:barstar family protein n=1 Tax=Streptomyces avidinii TaxID=1895 RepID=UPI003863C879